MNDYVNDAVALLQRLIATPSVSREEGAAADIIFQELTGYGFKPQRHNNNVWAFSHGFIEGKPTILLNAHIDTVKPVSTWTRDPFTPTLEGDRLYGLGANDCGGGLVSLMQVFRAPLQLPPSGGSAPSREQASQKASPMGGGLEGGQFIFLASAEEEVSGKDGISSMLPLLPKIDVAIVGEPTGMQPAVAEKGLMVLDVIAHGKSGHAAREEGVNAIYEALDDLQWIRSYRFDKVSPLLGPVKMQATVINAGTQHNVVPDECRVLVDVRTNELYTNKEVFDIIAKNLRSEVVAHSFRLNSSSIALDHPLVRRCVELGMQPFGSPTLSDQALMSFPSFKLGPGDSSRSHTADEYICISEIRHAIETYMQLLR
jgi:acetylornithine deacetylase